jgi:hypothetical protein
MKIAVVCDWLVTYAGAEKVLEIAYLAPFLPGSPPVGGRSIKIPLLNYLV